MILFLACLMSFTWRTGADNDPRPEDDRRLTEHYALGQFRYPILCELDSDTRLDS